MDNQSGKIIGEGLTYDDVLMVPAYSEILPRDVNVSTQFTKEITLNLRSNSKFSIFRRHCG